MKSIIGTSSSQFYQMMRYHLGWIDEQGSPLLTETGKLLRPILCLTSCHVVGGDWQKALPAAAVLELIHNFSLIHDDIEDQSNFRRHRRTLWKIWGQAQAINVGDGMYSLSRLAVLKLRNNGFADDIVFKVIELLDQACIRLCEGQYSDMNFENRHDVSAEEYLDMIGKKTANLISCSSKIGAILGTDDKNVADMLERFGLNLGISFQIKDDILGIWGAHDKIGKSKSDIVQRKKSLPIIYGLTSGLAGCADKIQATYDKEIIGNDDVVAITEILDKAGAKHYCQGLANEYYNEAISILYSLQLRKGAQAELKEIADFFIKRDF